MTSVLLLIAAIIILAITKWAIRFARRRLIRKVVLYQFQDSSYRLRIKRVWHVIGEKKAIETFISPVELSRLVRVSFLSANGQTYIGTYKKRLAGKFRRTLRERGAELEVYYEMPPFLRSAPKQYRLASSGGK